MKCPKCLSTIKKWKVLLASRNRGNPDNSLDSDNEDFSNLCDVNVRTAQCKKCFAICEQTISVGQYQDTWPVKLKMEPDRLFPWY